jgi:hypothetical protein
MRDLMKALELVLGGGGMFAMVGGGVAMVFGYGQHGFTAMKVGALAFVAGIAIKILRRLLLPD